jgi:2-polyprenyl-3-methyl-5-hydroxy-6-metoxy-1,4-benzoquinol methylase
VLLGKVLGRGTGLALLDVGFGAGELARRVKDHCRHLAGIELDAGAARLSAHLFDRWVEGDLVLALREKFETPFDVIVAGDVLEHLPDPGAVLNLLGPLLAPGGRLLVSLPNVANVTVRLGLLCGRFDYTSRGILDETHQRFFTRRTGRALLEAHGFRVVDVVPTAMPVELALPALGRPPLGPAVRGGALVLARALPGLFGYQFVYEAVRA